ncbi:MAG: polysaccharide biosynthesis tyrosine autokinase [Candidatus Brocadia sp.]|nr:polysaccharide biosynthesis tyrosine autokinase [Candidatus Brocadia sp.]
MNSDFSRSTLRDYLKVIFRHKAVIITTFVTILISVGIGLELKTPVYQSHVKMLISAEKLIDSPYYKVLGGYQQTELSLTQSEIVSSNPVIERTVKALKLDQRPFDYEKNFCSPLKSLLIDLRHKLSKPDQNNGTSKDVFVGLKNSRPQISNSDSTTSEDESYSFRLAVKSLKTKISVDPIRDTNLFTITASDFDPREAAMIANVVSRSYVIFDLEQQLAELQLQYGEKHPIVAQLKDNIDKMNKTITGETLSNIEAIGPASVKIVEQAQVPLESSGTDKRITLLLAVFMSLFLGVALAFGFEYIDHTFKSPQDVETFLNLPLLGSIPKKGFKNKTLIKDSKRVTTFLPAYQNLSDQIYLLMKDKGLKSILITAPTPLDGSTTIIANLANFLSHKAGHKVMVIDANLRAPAIHKVFNISDNSGLANVLEDKISLEKATHDLSPNLTILPAGNTSLNPTPLLDSTRMANVIKAAREKYELVFIDYANLRSFKDACVLCPYLDGIVLVVNEGKTRRHVLKELLTPLKHKKANLVGVILNNRTYAIPKMIYERL